MSTQYRFGYNKNIELISLLPSTFRETETETFLQFFQDFLNDLYTGIEGSILTDSTETESMTSGGIINSSANSAFTFNFVSSGTISGTTWTSGSNIVSGSLNSFSDLEQYDKIKISTENVWYDIDTISISGDYIELTGNYNTSASFIGDSEYLILNKNISILEKIKRIVELHDPELVDLEYLQYFAKYLGYNISIERTQLAEADSEEEINKYLRFVVKNLPNWYRIKTTRNAVKVLMFSFGLIADLYYYYAEYTPQYKDGKLLPNTEGAGYEERYDYYNTVKYTNSLRDSDGNLTLSGDVAPLRETNYYLTPHFIVKIELDKDTDQEFASNIQKQSNVIKNVNDIRPINTVFRGILGWLRRTLPIVDVHADSTTKYFETINTTPILEDIDIMLTWSHLDLSTKYFETIYD